MPNTYYVATNGSNDNLGTLEQPFASLAYAATKVQPGDTVYVRGGTYSLDEGIYLGTSGTADQRIVFQSYPDEIPILDGSNMPANQNIITVGGDYIDVKGFEVQNSPGIGITVWQSQHIRILDNVVHDSYLGAIFAGSVDDITSTQDIVISGNTVYNNGLVNQARELTGGWPAIVHSFGASNVTFTNNYVYNNYGEGIDFILTNGGLASGNILHDNYSVNLYLDNASNIIVENNFIYTTNNPEYFTPHFFDSPQPASGIQVANEPYSISNPLDNVQIRNNIVVGGRSAFYYGIYGNGGGMKNFTLVNNTFYGANLSLISIDEDAGHLGNEISKNIFYQTDNKPLTYLPANLAELVFSNNLWNGGSAGLAASVGDLIIDPLFVNPGGLSSRDYALQAGSLALVAGVGSQPLNLEIPIRRGNNQPIPIIPITPPLLDKNIFLTADIGAGNTVELLDLRNLDLDENGQADSPVKLVFSGVGSDAVYKNAVGLYVVQNEQGTVIDSLSGEAINPGDPGYAEAALGQRVSGVDLREFTDTLVTQLDGNLLLAPYIIADGTVEEFLTQNPGNQPGQGMHAYFAYLGANPDGVQHLRRLGTNQFEFEDLWGGGDNDFNDMVFTINIELA